MILRGRPPPGLLKPAKAAARAKAESTPRAGRAARVLYPGGCVGILVDLPPRPKHRARTYADEEALVRAFAAARGDAGAFRRMVGGGGIMRTSSTAATKDFEGAVRLVAAAAMAAARLPPFLCPVQILIQFRYAGDPETWPVAHQDADLDNLEKSILDGMEGPVYGNDRRVVRKFEEKVCAERAGIAVTVAPADPSPATYHQLERWFFAGPLPRADGTGV